MKNSPKIIKLLKSIAKARKLLVDTQRELERAQEDCLHKKTVTWTNNDGQGQFIVERCESCGLQKDGGIKN